MTRDEEADHDIEIVGDVTVEDVEFSTLVDGTGQESDDDNDAKHQELPEEMLGCNTPRKRKEVAKCWTTIKRLKPCDKRPPHIAKWEKKLLWVFMNSL